MDPNLSPIELVWDSIGRTIQRLPILSARFIELDACIKDAWDKIQQKDLDYLVMFLPRRIRECYNGGATHYFHLFH